MADTHAHGGSTAHEETHHEGSDVDVAPVFKFLGYLAGFAVLVHLAVWLMLGFFQRQASGQQEVRYPLATGQGERLPPEPRLQVEPRADYEAYRQREQQLLDRYSWVDKNAGVVRVPMDRAMQLVVEKGIPSRAPGAAPEAAAGAATPATAGGATTPATPGGDARPATPAEGKK